MSASTSQLALWCIVYKLGDPKVLPDVFEDVRLQEWLKLHTKDYVFQLELGKETLDFHYQIWVRLKEKNRSSNEKKIWVGNGFLDVEFDATRDETAAKVYCQKADTRVRGPWSSELDEAAKPAYIPLQCRDIDANPYPYQASITATFGVFDPRKINVLITDGNDGKSSFTTWAAAKRLARKLPPLSTYEQLLGYVMTSPPAQTYLIDIPRGMDWKEMKKFWTGIESLKDGYITDWRYKAAERIIDCPTIWCFTNTMPERAALTLDKWAVWHVVDMKLEVLGDGIPPLPPPPVFAPASERLAKEPRGKKRKAIESGLREMMHAAVHAGLK